MHMLIAMFASAAVWLSPGFKIGSQLSDSSPRGPYLTYNNSYWTGGPSIEVHLPHRFSLEFNALFRSRRVQGGFPTQFGENLNTILAVGAAKTNTWDFPLMAKYRFHFAGLRPFASAGYQWSRYSTSSTFIYQCLGPQGSCTPAGSPGLPGGYSTGSRIRGGTVLGLGMEFGGKRVSIIPETRFHRDGITAQVGFRFGKRR